jgi:glyoxylase-like metal-dependent hydrolase (beta-lactamase superfamily II)
MALKIKSFLDEVTSTFSYVISDTDTNSCAVIDSVLDYDQFSGVVKTSNADLIIDYIKSNNLNNEWILETHIHADHITASLYLKNKIGGKIAIGSKITEILKYWVDKFETSDDTRVDSSQFDKIFEDGEVFKIGNLVVKVMHTPGHTPACACYYIGDSIFVGDTLFAPSLGTARCDFPGGSAKELYNSIMKIYSLPESTKIYLCHDYPKNGEEYSNIFTIKEQKAKNIMLNKNTSLDEFVKLRTDRDRTLSVPKLLLPSIQCNIRLGDFGRKSNKGNQYIKIPVSYS